MLHGPDTATCAGSECFHDNTISGADWNDPKTDLYELALSGVCIFCDYF